MRTFIATLVLTAFVSAADEEAAWSRAESCQVTDLLIGKWYGDQIKGGKLFPNQTAAGQEWSTEQIADYDAAISVIQNWAPQPQAEQSVQDAANDVALTAIASLDNLSWLDSQNAAITDVEISEMAGYPTLPADFDADCNGPAAEAEAEIPVETWGLTNMHEAMPLTDLTTSVPAATVGDPAVITSHGTIQGRTGWYNPGGGSDASLVYQFAFEYTESEAVKTANAGGVGATRLALVWANDAETEAMEIDEFGNLGALSGNFFLTMRQRMVTAPTPPTDVEKAAEGFVAPTPQTISDVEGYTPMDEGKSKFGTWWTTPVLAGMSYEQGPLSAYTYGGWAPVKQLTQWLGGWETTPTDMKWRMVMSKSTNLGGLTNIKQGGKVHLVAGYKPDKAATAFAVKTGPVEIKWAEEAEDEEVEGGEVTTGGDKTEDAEDGATSVTTFGAAVLAAISALAF